MKKYKTMNFKFNSWCIFDKSQKNALKYTYIRMMNNGNEMEENTTNQHGNKSGSIFGFFCFLIANYKTFFLLVFWGFFSGCLFEKIHARVEL